MVPALLTTLIVASGDMQHAETERAAANTLYDKYSGASDPLWFEGHWGFQYYLQSKGGRAIDFFGDTLAPSQIVVIPHENCGIMEFPATACNAIGIHRFPPGPVLRMATTLRPKMGVNFYSCTVSEPFPFVIAPISAEAYSVVQMKQILKLQEATTH